MPVQRARLEDCLLLVIDLQERLMPTIVDRHRVVTNASILLRMAGELRLPYLVTEQYPKGLGRTVEEITESMPDPSRRIEKTRFSAAVNLVRQQLEAGERGTVILAGVEAHVCVLQTALDLLAAGYQCLVCTDAISASQRDQIEPALRRMERAGTVPTGVISLLYELLGDSSHPAFRACLELAKAVEQ